MDLGKLKSQSVEWIASEVKNSNESKISSLIDSLYKNIQPVLKNGMEVAYNERLDKNVAMPPIIQKAEKTAFDYRDEFIRELLLKKQYNLDDGINSTIDRHIDLILDNIYQAQVLGKLNFLEQMGAKQYKYVVGSDGACSNCRALKDRIYNVADANIGSNFPEIHPNCRCSIIGIDPSGNTINDEFKELAPKFIFPGFWDIIKNIGALFALRNIAYKQYPWINIFAISPITLSLLESRIRNSIESVEKNKSSINSASNKYGVPAEIIGGIIYKEQLTSKLPDTIANIDTFLDGKLIPGSTPTHSTGLGAIFPATARTAWNFVDSSMVSNISDKDLQFKLSSNKDFNIKTIAAVLIYEVENAKVIQNPSESKNLTIGQWKKAVAKYNGSDEYARKVYEYLGAIYELLN